MKNILTAAGQTGIHRTIEDGYIINMNKPESWSSFDVVRKLRNITRIKKVGHAGTLDPFATGVLLVCLGRATKQVSELMKLPKEYIAELELGRRTDTLDITGEIIGEEDVPELALEDVRNALQTFVGKIKQRIPDYSAAKVGGRRLYKMARSGEAVPERYKWVEIHQLDFLGIEGKIVRFRVLCSRGTYVRTLGLDIARKLGTTGFLRNLSRTRIGDFSIDDALDIPGFEQKWKMLKANENISDN